MTNFLPLFRNKIKNKLGVTWTSDESGAQWMQIRKHKQKITNNQIMLLSLFSG